MVVEEHGTSGCFPLDDARERMNSNSNLDVKRYMRSQRVQDDCFFKIVIEGIYTADVLLDKLFLLPNEVYTTKPLSD